MPFGGGWGHYSSAVIHWSLVSVLRCGSLETTLADSQVWQEHCQVYGLFANTVPLLKWSWLYLYASTICAKVLITVLNWRDLSAGIQRSVVRWMSIDVSEEHVAFILGSRSRLYLLPASRWYLVWLTFRPWRWKPNVPPTYRMTQNELYGLHNVISQKTEIFIITSARTSNPTQRYTVST
jgi:hypothetical protein